MNSNLNLLVLPGDGIGQEVMFEALKILNFFNLPFNVEFGEIGWECWKKYGDPIPVETWNKINKADAILLGAITSKPHKEAQEELDDSLKDKGFSYISPVIQLRKKLDLFANIRPVKNFLGKGEAFNLCVIRENTEGLYAGYDYYPVPAFLKPLLNSGHSELKDKDLSCSFRIQTRSGLYRLYQYAFEYALKNDCKRVTLADKPNVLRNSSVLAREIFEEIAADERFQNIKADIQNVDAIALWLVKRPQQFGVIVAENMFGDILSDLAAGVMGGLGLAPSANIGFEKCYFEPVHGSAPNMQQNKANPMAMILTIAQMLNHLKFYKEAKLIEDAISNVIKRGKCLTYDLDGNNSTTQVTKAVLQELISPGFDDKSIGVIVVGDELLDGSIADTNSLNISKKLAEERMCVRKVFRVGDNEIDIKNALTDLLENCEAIIIIGGLGPTSDDLTRFAVAKAVKKDLVFYEEAFKHIVQRLNKFGITLTENNRQQAIFPYGSTLLENENGTAYGSMTVCKDKKVFMLPGPPKECLPIFEKKVLLELAKYGFKQNHKANCQFMLINVIEGEVSEYINELMKDYPEVEMGTVWRYPYVEVKLRSLNSRVLNDLFNSVSKHYIDCFVGEGSQLASERLLNIYKENPQLIEKIKITDMLTNGLWSDFCNKKVLSIHKDIGSEGHIELYAAGLDEYYQNKPFTGTTNISITINNNNERSLYEIKIPFRGEEVITYAFEYLCYILLKIVKEQ